MHVQYIKRHEYIVLHQPLQRIQIKLSSTSFRQIYIKNTKVNQIIPTSIIKNPKFFIFLIKYRAYNIQVQFDTTYLNI